MYKASRDESNLINEVEKRKDATLDTSLEKPMDLGLDEPIKDDDDIIHLCFILKNLKILLDVITNSLKY